MTNSDMTCKAFDAALSDHLEGTLDGSMRASVEQHLRECVRCASLARDLENIQREAAALPDLAPSRDLWAGIEGRIAAPVIPLAVVRPERQRRFAPAWIGAAAAALIVSTAGITYMLTARSLRPGSDARVAAATPLVGRTLPPTGETPAAETNALDTQPAGPPSSGGVVEPGAPRFTQTGSTQRTGVPARLVSQELDSSRAHSDVVYGKEIEMLQKIVRERNTQLDPSTVAIIEKNLQIIDAAIAQSRAALARDPGSMLLSEQLTHALDNKVELLRTAAMLPASI
jgi:Putative zinc-finger